MRRNLISMSKMECIGYNNLFGVGKVKLLLELAHSGIRHDGL
jgi:hypothetical protein